MSWYYLSFVKDDAFAGACIVEGAHPAVAIQEAWDRGINPGGEVMAISLGDDPGPVLPRNRLLSRADIGPGKTVGELERDGVRPGRFVRFTD